MIETSGSVAVCSASDVTSPCGSALALLSGVKSSVVVAVGAKVLGTSFVADRNTLVVAVVAFAAVVFANANASVVVVDALVVTIGAAVLGATVVAVVCVVVMVAAPVAPNAFDT